MRWDLRFSIGFLGGFVYCCNNQLGNGRHSAPAAVSRPVATMASAGSTCAGLAWFRITSVNGCVASHCVPYGEMLLGNGRPNG